MSSGDNSNHVTKGNTRTQTTLLLNANFVKPGHVRFRYKVDGQEGKDGLQFIVDVTVAKWAGTQVTLYQQTEWAEQTVQVEAGAHTLKWRYEKDDSMDFGDDRAYLEIVEVYGTAHSDTLCEPCYLGYSATCRVCKANEYADSEVLGFSTENMCKTCASGRYSEAGAVGKDECLEKPVCTEEDVVPISTECKEDSRTVKYKYEEPHICKNDPDNKIPLTVNFAKQCVGCSPGYTPSTDGKYQCDPCALGAATDDAGDASACVYCSEGKFAQKILVLGQNTRHGWQGDEGSTGEWLYEGFMTDSMSGWDRLVNTKSGVKSDVTMEALATSPGGGDVGAEEGEDEHLVLPLQIDMINEGYVNFTYEIRGSNHVRKQVKDGEPADRSLSRTDKAELLASFSAQSFESSEDDLGIDSHGTYDLENKDGTYSAGFPLCPGKHMLRWVWTRSNVPAWVDAEDRMIIKTITIVGADTGGAHKCETCPPGTEVDLERGDTDMSMEGASHSVKVKIRDRCRPCNAGMYNDGSSTACRPCDGKLPHCAPSATPFAIVAVHTFKPL
jgi:hypothetical protein